MRPATSRFSSGVCTMAKTERLQIRISPEFKTALQRLAEAENRTVSNYIENLIREKLQRL